jgi:hypothetical protein
MGASLNTFRVRVRVRIRVRVRVRVVLTTSLNTFSVSVEFTVLTGKRSGHPRGMPLATRMAALQAKA